MQHATMMDLMQQASGAILQFHIDQDMGDNTDEGLLATTWLYALAADNDVHVFVVWILCGTGNHMRGVCKAFLMLKTAIRIDCATCPCNEI